MNRALGFGVLAGSTLPMLVATASPASAHGVNMRSQDGMATVYSMTGNYHFMIGAVDFDAHDNVGTRAEYTLADGRKSGVTAPEGGSRTTGRFPESYQIVAFRKCHRIGNDPWGCANWSGV